MNERRILKALAEGAISYGFFLLMTTPNTDLVRAQARAYLMIARTSQSLATWFGRLGIAAERKSSECLS